jgi:hypothetical protein
MNSALTSKLLGHLHRIFDKDPDQSLLFRLQYPVPYLWEIKDGVLTLTGPEVATLEPLLLDGSWLLGGSETLDGWISGVTTTISTDLSEYTVGSLIAYLRDTLGYTIEYQSSEMMNLSALVLLDGNGDPSQSNGDHFYGYRSLLWSYVSSISSELHEATIAVSEMLKQMSINLASSNWLDEHGGYYKVGRILGELDASYGPRIIAETLRPKSNNKAIESAIFEASGVRVKVIDATNSVAGIGVGLHDSSFLYDGSRLYSEYDETTAQNLFDGTWTYNGSRRYSQVDITSMRCQFDVVVNVPNIGVMSASDLMLVISDQVNRLRAAGTFMRKIFILTGIKYDGTSRFDGTKQFDGVTTSASV